MVDTLPTLLLTIATDRLLAVASKMLGVTIGTDFVAVLSVLLHSARTFGLLLFGLAGSGRGVGSRGALIGTAEARAGL